MNRSVLSNAVMAGFGLGLWIEKAIVEAHGGRIAVASRLGHGATFTVEFMERSPP